MFSVFISIGLNPLAWVINSEIYPMWARGRTVAIAAVFYYVAVFVSLETFLTLIDVIGQPKVLALYGVMNFIGTIFIIFLLPETGNK